MKLDPHSKHNMCHGCMHGERPEVDAGYLLLPFLTLFFETKSISETGTHWLTRLIGQGDPRILLSSLPSAEITETHHQPQLFSMCWWCKHKCPSFYSNTSCAGLSPSPCSLYSLTTWFLRWFTGLFCKTFWIPWMKKKIFFWVYLVAIVIVFSCNSINSSFCLSTECTSTQFYKSNTSLLYSSTTWVWLTGTHIDDKLAKNELVMLKFMCQVGWASVPTYLASLMQHFYERYFSWD